MPPDFESDKEYLKAIEGAVKRELINSPLLSCAIGNDWEKLVKEILMPKAKDYSQKLDSERKANKGIKREKAKPEEVKAQNYMGGTILGDADEKRGNRLSFYGFGGRRANGRKGGSQNDWTL